MKISKEEYQEYQDMKKYIYYKVDLLNKNAATLGVSSRWVWTGKDIVMVSSTRRVREDDIIKMVNGYKEEA